MKEQRNDELGELPPLLRDLRRQDDGFRVPEGYFEAIEDSVFERLERSGSGQKPWEIRRGGRLSRLMPMQTAAAIAATLALVLAAWWFFRPDPGTVPEQGTLAAELTEAEIESYVLENIRDFDADLLADLPPAEMTAPAPESPTPVPETKTRPGDPLDDLSEEELELLLKEMSDEELEDLLKT